MSKGCVEKIGLFGGSFDPPTLGHTQIADSFLRHSGISELVISPAGLHAGGKQYGVEKKHRLFMAQLMVGNLQQTWGERAQLSTYELDSSDFCYTYTELARLSKIYAHAQVSLLIGADCVNTFHTWHNFQEILRDFSVLVHPRPYTTYSLLPGMTLIDAPEINGASGAVKQMIGRGESVESWLLPEVHNYIQQNHLYGMK